MDALIFDFDGVIVDSEPIHFMGFAKVLAQRGIELSKAEYYTRYLGYDDHDCFAAVLRDHGMEADESAIFDMTARKTRLVQHDLAVETKALPGAVELIREAELAGIPMAICSGALGQEVELASRAIKVREYFMTVVSAENVEHGKPSPEGYRLARRELERLTGRVLLARRCVVIEDSPAGIEAAHAAGMKVLAVATSYEPPQLAQADRVAASLSEVNVALLESLVKEA